jgi:drug/metabolite transporter (DMT)-like permease
MSLATNYNLWSVAGLVYAFAGAALICNASFLTPRPKPVSAHAVENERDVLRRMSQQWLDTRIGGLLLAAGFFLQMTGALGTTSLNTPAVFVLLALAVSAGYYALSKDLLAENLLPPEVLQDIRQTSFEAPPVPAALAAEHESDTIEYNERSETAA